MKQIIEYTAYGSDREDLLANVEHMYQTFLGDESAVLPGNSVVEMSPETEISSMDGTRRIVSWTAVVHVSTNTAR